MIAPLALLALLLSYVLAPCDAFSTVSCRPGSCFEVNVNSAARRRLIQSTLAPVNANALLTSTYLTATNDNNEPLERNQTVINTTITTSEEVHVVKDDTSVEGEPKKGLFARFRGKKFDRTSLAKLGGSVLLSYGFVSNVFGITCVSCAWYIASRKVSGVSRRSWFLC